MHTFAPVSDDSFEQLYALAEPRSLVKGEVLVRPGQIARKIYFVCSGILISLFIKEEGETHIKNFFVPHNFAGSTVSLQLQSPSSFSIEALCKSVVLEMDYQLYKEKVYQHQDLKNFYIAYLEQKWVVENEKRQISFATQNASERYVQFLKDYPELEQQVSQRLIASYLGITPTQLSRIRREL